jgi:NAD(P)H dehydrogenase (quinone)
LYLSRKALIVLAHPSEQSLSRHFAQAAFDELKEAGYEVDLLDLCKIGFDPVLSRSERARYYSDTPDQPAHVAELSNANVLLFIFPTWWFGMPAVLKGWVDRVFAPGIAFDHAEDFGPINPRLTALQHVIVITTLGSPWWVDWLVMFRPVRRTLKRAVFGLCAPNARFQMLAFYRAEIATEKRVQRFCERVRRACKLPA